MYYDLYFTSMIGSFSFIVFCAQRSASESIIFETAAG